MDAKRTRDKVTKHIAEYLNNLEKRNVIQSYSVGKVSILWDTMTFKEKLKWYWYNRIFKELGNQCRMDLHIRNRIQYIMTKQTFPLDDPADHYIEEKTPCYLEYLPKTMIISDIIVVPVTPVEMITMSFIIKNEEETKIED